MSINSAEQVTIGRCKARILGLCKPRKRSDAEKAVDDLVSFVVGQSMIGTINGLLSGVERRFGKDVADVLRNEFFEPTNKEEQSHGKTIACPTAQPKPLEPSIDQTGVLLPHHYHGSRAVDVPEEEAGRSHRP